MSNLMQDTAVWIGSQLKNVAGRAGVYKRGTSASGNITGVVANLQQEVVNEEGFGTGFIVTGWQFVASELMVNSVAIEPRAGDIWEETLNGESLAWEAMPPSPRQKVWEWQDTSKNLIIVWMKRVYR